MAGRLTVECHSLSDRSAHLCRARVQNTSLGSFHPKDDTQSGGPVWEALWPCTCTLDILQILVTAKEFHDAKKYGSRAELFFLKLRRGTDPIEPGHVSTESLFFHVSLRTAGCEASRWK